MEEVSQMEDHLVVVLMSLRAQFEEGSEEETMYDVARVHGQSSSGNMDRSGVYSSTGTIMSGVMVLFGSAARRSNSWARPLPSWSCPCVCVLRQQVAIPRVPDGLQQFVVGQCLKARARRAVGRRGERFEVTNGHQLHRTDVPSFRMLLTRSSAARAAASGSPT
jgi:hypothetical protein